MDCAMKAIVAAHRDFKIGDETFINLPNIERIISPNSVAKIGPVIFFSRKRWIILGNTYSSPPFSFPLPKKPPTPKPLTQTFRRVERAVHPAVMLDEIAFVAIRKLTTVRQIKVFAQVLGPVMLKRACGQRRVSITISQVQQST